MGQGLSCRKPHEQSIFTAVRDGELDTVEAIIAEDPTVLGLTTACGCLSPLHVAAANGRTEVLSMLLDRSVNPDILNHHKQTPLMLAAMHGKIACVERLFQAGANILMFDSVHGRTCLHYAACHGHSDCLQAILSVAHSSPVAHSWGFARFLNVKDKDGATPLHLAARHRQAECVHILLSSGALVCASTGRYGHLGSTPLHLAARGGSLDCVRELLARGANRLKRDSSGRTPYLVALKHKHKKCAALLNPSSPEPFIWPSSLKFIEDLNLEAKVLLEKALVEANKEREKAILNETVCLRSSSFHSDSGDTEDGSEASDVDLCCICFEQVCTIEVQNCGHQMCAQCTLALCCHSKPNSTTSCLKVPACPFCRSSIAQLVVVNSKSKNDTDLELSSSKPRKSRKSFNFCEGSDSFKGLSTMGSFGKVGPNSGKIAAEGSNGVDEV